MTKKNKVDEGWTLFNDETGEELNLDDILTGLESEESDADSEFPDDEFTSTEDEFSFTDDEDALANEFGYTIESSEMSDEDYEAAMANTDDSVNTDADIGTFIEPGSEGDNSELGQETTDTLDDLHSDIEDGLDSLSSEEGDDDGSDGFGDFDFDGFGDEGDGSDLENLETSENGDLSDEEYEAQMNGDENAGTEGTEGQDDNYQGVIRTVKGAYLVYKRDTGDGNFEELWIQSVGKDLEKSVKIKKAILAGTDIDPSTNQSDDGNQEAEVTAVGNVQFVKITGLQN